MRSLLAFIAAGWFAVAAFQNGANPGDADVDPALGAVRAIAQTLCVGLAILSVAVADWDQVIAYFDVKANPRTK